MPHTVNFGVPDKFKKEKAFTQVKFGEDGHLLEVELNEMQKIALEKIRDVTRAMFGDCALQGGQLSIVNGKLNINNQTVAINGDLITMDNMVVTVASGNSVYVATNEIEITSNTPIKSGGNPTSSTTVTNDLLDPRIGEESSRRIQLTYAVTTTKPTTGNYIELCKIAGTSPNFTVTPVTYTDSLNQLELLPIIQRYTGYLKDLSTTGKSSLVQATNEVLSLFNTHKSDAVAHVTKTERDTWNAKETTTGAQSKADKAEDNAKKASVSLNGDSKVTGSIFVTNGVRPMISGKNGEDSVDTYPQGLSFQASSGQETGFPSPYGSLVTFHDSVHRNFQIFNEKGKDTIHIRAYNGDTKSWSVWSKLETSTEVDRKIKVHTDDNIRHITGAERTAWNAKADRATTYSKGETDTKINEVLGMNQDLLATIQKITEQLGNNESAVGAIMTSLDGKVDKVSGKGLSTNDYTTAEKNKLAGLNNYALPVATTAVLGGIKSGRDLNVQPDGTVEIADNSHAHTIDNVTGLQSALNNKASLSHNHDTAYTASGNAIYSVQAGDVRVTTPTQFGATAPAKYKEVQFLFTGLNNTSSSPYADALVLSTYHDSSGGNINMLLFDKTKPGVYLQQGAYDGATWGAKRKLAFLDEVVDTTTYNSHVNNSSIHKNWGNWDTNGSRDLRAHGKRVMVAWEDAKDRIDVNYNGDFKNGVNFTGPVKIQENDVVHSGWNLMLEKPNSVTFADDWNAVTESGRYRVDDGMTTGAPRHATAPPAGAYTYGTLEVYRAGNNTHIFQRYTSHGRAEVWVRAGWSKASWSAWRKLADEAYVNTEITKQVSRAGDTMTGNLTLEGVDLRVNIPSSGTSAWARGMFFQKNGTFLAGFTAYAAVQGAGVDRLSMGFGADPWSGANKGLTIEANGTAKFDTTLDAKQYSENGTPLANKYAGYNVKINSGAGLLGGSNIGTDTTLSVNFGGNGTATQVARSDHNHDSVYAKLSHGTHVPTPETANNYKFLRNDNTWQQLPWAGTGQGGVVQLTNATNSTSEIQAPTALALKNVYDLANGRETTSGAQSKANTAETNAKNHANNIVGAPANLNTIDKANLVNAINEINANYNVTRSSIDANGIAQVVEWANSATKVRFRRSELSNPDANGNYRTGKIMYYTNGTTVAVTETWTYTYDANGNLTSEVKA